MVSALGGDIRDDGIVHRLHPDEKLNEDAACRDVSCRVERVEFGHATPQSFLTVSKSTGSTLGVGEDGTGA